MNNPLAQGAIVLAISLATVGAVATADQGAASGSPGAALVLRSEAVVGAPGATNTGVPIHDGRIDDQVSPPKAEVTPTQIRVGAITLQAPVIPVGVDQKDQFDVPAADTVGWYRYGPRPGQPGASVLAAHVDYGGKHGAFFHLRDLETGDLLDVVMSDGSTMSFRVTGNFQYDKTQLPADELFRKDGAPVLHLITCGGTFNPARHSYEANVVVTAEPVNTATGPMTA